MKNSILVKYLENSNFSQNLKSKQHKIDLMLNDIINQEYKKMKPKLIKKLATLILFFLIKFIKKISYFKKSLKSKKNFSLFRDSSRSNTKRYRKDIAVF